MKRQFLTTLLVASLVGSPAVAGKRENHLSPDEGQATPSRLLNISTRARILTGDNVLIAGFIVTGTDPKKVIVRAIGPSLAQAGIQDALGDPTIELYDATGRLMAQNDNWEETQKTEIEATTIPPSHPFEAAVVATLPAGGNSYTAVIRGKNNTTGVAVVEVYDLDAAGSSRLANVSSRSFVQTGENVMIAGLIVGGDGGGDLAILSRGIGPSLAQLGVQGALLDPTLELRDANGDLVGFNNDWADSQQQAIVGTTLAPQHPAEAAILSHVAPGLYTSVVRGQNNTTGIAVIEVYRLDALVTVPNITGLTEALAIAQLNSADLAVGTITGENSSSVPPGYIISQTPAPGSFVSRGGFVDLSVSIGIANGLPPDPALVAPLIPPNSSSDFTNSTKFLYSGPNPIQTGVAPGTIDALRGSVLRGRVLLRDGTALSGVKVSILNHSEFGQTLSRADGTFDVAANGGGQLVVKYDKDGYLPVQRSVPTTWRDYAVLPDVVLIPYDTAVTPLEVAAPSMQVARATAITDSDGSRRATVLVPAGTTADMVMNNGTHLALNTMHLRATEYTVGASGPNAMPAALPPSSGYTYCAELSLDEAVSNGAAEVVFNQPLPTYVENFLGFPVGTAVPTGYYDRTKGEWVASPNGRVVKILGSTNGLADLDTDGDGVADDTTKLAALGVTAEERSRLAQLYVAGQSLWRVPVTHFSPHDHNWPYGPPVNAAGPPGAPRDNPQIKIDNEQCGSVIGCESQTLGESLPVTGTSWRLYYKSDRTPGRKEAYRFTVPVSASGAVPMGLHGIRVALTVAGRQFKAEFAPAADLSYTVDWDGRDAYGRFLPEPQVATIQVDYDYVPQYYAVRADRDNAFARAEAADVAVNASRQSSFVTLSRTYTQQMGAFDARSAGLNGWTLGPHHTYLPISRTIQLGYGRRRVAAALPSEINTIAGDGTSAHSGDGGPALTARFSSNRYIAAAPDGSYYVCESSDVRRVGADGIITTVAGNYQTSGFGGDGGQATNAKLNQPKGIAVAADGSLYIADELNRRVRRVSPDGIITTIAGNGTIGAAGDGGPAAAATLNDIHAIAFGPDGSLFIADAGARKIRRIGPDGIITTFAGTGVFGFSGDGGKATAANLGGIRGVAVTKDGTVFIADESFHRVRRVGTDGIITTVAGNGSNQTSGDGALALQAGVASPRSIRVGPDGALYILQLDHRVRVVVDGVITPVAGNGIGIYAGDGGPATASQIGPVGALGSDIAITPDNALLIADQGRIRRIRPAFAGFNAADVLIPSEDGTELYIFNASGRHLKTLDAQTNAARYQFGYNNAGYLTNITDESGNVTIVESSGGTAAAIVAPGGQRTRLTSDAQGWLTSVANPANETYAMTYNADGLLQTFADPRGGTHRFTYDALGLLTKDEDPAGGTTSLARTKQVNGYTVITTSALGRSHTYQVEQLPTGGLRRTTTSTSGAQTVTLIGLDGAEQTTLPTGMTLNVAYGGDPRWAMLAPVPKSVVIKTPAGLTRTITSTRSAILSNPADLLSQTKLTETSSDNGATLTQTYDAATRTLTRTTAVGRSRTEKFDGRGRLVQSQVAGIEAVDYVYDALGRLSAMTQGTGAAARKFEFTYNPKNELISVRDPVSRTVGFAYNAAERVSTETLPDNSSIDFTYDQNGNLSAITPPGRPPHSFGYSLIDQVTSYTPPDIGIGNTSTQYSYDTDHGATRLTRPDGQLVNFAYDSAGRLSNLAIPRGATTFSYDSADRIAATNAPGGLGLTYTYDGSLVTLITATGAVAGNIGGTYDARFQQASVSVNGATPVTFSHDNDGLLTGAGSMIVTRSSQNGLITNTALGVVTDAFIYNSFGELATYTAKANGATQVTTQYTRDTLGRITGKTETIAGVTDNYSYSYDLIGRLTNVQKNGTVSEAYTYDANGNRLNANVNGVAKSATYDAHDRLKQYGGTTYVYNPAGELVSKTAGGQVTTYSYDQLGSLVNVTLPGGSAVAYLVDGQNRRIGKQANGTLVQGLLYQSQLRPIAELDGSGNVISRFVYASNGNSPAFIIKAGTTFRVIADQLGSPRLIVDTSIGAVAQRMDYDSFGNVINDTNPGFQPFGFAGGLYDRDTKLVRFGARDYDPEVGRWTAKDPILFAGGTDNLYSYVGGDPINFVDIDGLRPTAAELQAKIDLDRKLLASGLFKDKEADLYKDIDDNWNKLKCGDYDPPKPATKKGKPKAPNPKPSGPQVPKLNPLPETGRGDPLGWEGTDNVGRSGSHSNRYGDDDRPDNSLQLYYMLSHDR